MVRALDSLCCIRLCVARWCNGQSTGLTVLHQTVCGPAPGVMVRALDSLCCIRLGVARWCNGQSTGLTVLHQTVCGPVQTGCGPVV